MFPRVLSFHEKRSHIVKAQTVISRPMDSHSSTLNFPAVTPCHGGIWAKVQRMIIQYFAVIVRKVTTYSSRF